MNALSCPLELSVTLNHRVDAQVELVANEANILLMRQRDYLQVRAEVVANQTDTPISKFLPKETKYFIKEMNMNRRIERCCLIAIVLLEFLICHFTHWEHGEQGEI